MEDFEAALRMDPGNAELAKLLQTAKDKFLEVEGVSVEEAARVIHSARVRTEDARASVDQASPAPLPLAVEHGSGLRDLLMPAAGAQLVLQGRLREHQRDSASQPSSGSGFVRISVVSDDEEDEEAEEAEQDAASAPAGFSRVAIVEGSDSEEEQVEERGGEVAEGQPGTTAIAAEKIASAETLKDRGNQLLKANRAAEAVQAYTDSLAVVPGYLPSLNNRAQAYLALKVRI